MISTKWGFHMAGRVLVLVCMLCAAGSARAGPPDDAARILAGLMPAPGSPLTALTQAPGWRVHAAEMNALWRAFERGIATRIRVWSAAKLPPSPPAMFYMFGGPDFPHADAFFPDSSVYVLSGLEPVGAPPDPAALSGAQLAAALAGLRHALGNYMQHGYFITREMLAQLKAGPFKGTLPVIYLFLARSGKTINQVEFVSLTSTGKAVPHKGSGRARGVRITFTGEDGVSRTLYYFSTDLSDGGVAKSGFLAFCANQGAGGALLKSASYLLHNAGFSKVREFLLTHSTVIVQDDTGIPFRYFAGGGWRLRAFGAYVPPIPVFKNRYQDDIAHFFAQGSERINFRMGYHSNAGRTNVLVAEKLAAGVQ